eukprot:GGOE01003397.1.p1 GENE.GGOE01003397.1~~GGOE01003397.1.p1  ORF type:complete len:138 (-),score=15.74 GGOE01003397.1:706-1095(-)
MTNPYGNSAAALHLPPVGSGSVVSTDVMIQNTLTRRAAKEKMEEHLSSITIDDVPGKRKPHPLYATTNSEYGKRNEVSNGSGQFNRTGEFTRKFPMQANRFAGLDTSKNRNPCLPNPSFGTNPFHETFL